MKKILSRRDFLKSSASLLALSGLAGARTALAASSTEVLLHSLKVRIPHLPKNFDGFRIGFLSDPHLGPWVPDDLVAQGVRLLMSERADLILLGGDFIGIPDAFPGRLLPYVPNPGFNSTACKDLPEAIYTRAADILGKLKAPAGVFAVYGNHDNWVEPQLCSSKLGAKGIRLLKNDQVRVARDNEELLLIGSEDYWTGIPVWPKLGPRLSHQTRILLSHNPDYVSYLLDSTTAEFDLALCGHTHGGQIKLPLIGALSYNIEDTRFADGLVAHQRAQVFTSRGIGVVEVPFRLNCPPEVNLLMLVR